MNAELEKEKKNLQDFIEKLKTDYQAVKTDYDETIHAMKTVKEDKESLEQTLAVLHVSLTLSQKWKHTRC